MLVDMCDAIEAFSLTDVNGVKRYFSGVFDE